MSSTKTVAEIMQPLRRATSADGTIWQLSWMWTSDRLMVWRADPGCAMEQHFVITDERIAHMVFETFVGQERLPG